MAQLDTWANELENVIRHAGQDPERHLPFGIRDLQHLREEAEWVLNGIQQGFDIIKDPTPDIPPFQVRNYPLAFVHKDAISADIDKELSAGILYESPTKPTWATAINAVDEGDKIRIIRDYSSPTNRAINDHTWNTDTWKLMNFNHAVELLRSRPNCYMAKVDISSAYRAIPVRPTHWEYLSFEWLGKFIIDTRLPFGLSNAPEIFVRITNLIRGMLAARGILATVVYVDDFLIMGDTEEECRAAWKVLIELLTNLGFTVNLKPHKSIPPTTCITFLGIILDSDVRKDGSGQMEARMGPERMAAAIETCRNIATKVFVPRKQFEQVIGTLSFIANTVYGARPYLRRMISCLWATKSSMITIDKGTQLDLQFWIRFATTFNGKAIIMAKPVVPPHFFSVDASTDGYMGKGGIGGFFNGKYFGYSIDKLISKGTPEHIKACNRKFFPNPLRPETMHINYLELFVVWWAMVLFDQDWEGYHLTVHTDNNGALFMINKGTARAPHFMSILRAMTARMALGGYRVQATRITTDENILADPLSRGKWTEFHSELKNWARDHPQGMVTEPMAKLSTSGHMTAFSFPSLP